MMLRRLALLVAASALVVVAAENGLSSQAATGPATIRITTKQVRYERVDVGRPGRTPGDMEIIVQLLYNRRVTSRAIGHADYVCTFTLDTSRSCRGTIFLPRGQVVVGGSFQFRQIYALAVLGGTGLFDNARGMVTVTRLGVNPRRELMLFRLTG
jgi:hypothetical protein